MKGLEFAAVQRSALFSPNHVGNDAAILLDTARELTQAGHVVRMYTEQEFLLKELCEPCVFTMMRSGAAVRKLEQMEQNGLLVINPASGIRNCSRERMTFLLLESQIAYPESIACDTNVSVAGRISEDFTPCWVKRADFHAIHREDVSYVRHLVELQEILIEYALRGIRRVVISRHLPGDLIKFYGVAGSGFFHWFYPFDKQHSKFGLEAINGRPAGIGFSVESLQALCEQAADVLNVQIYGGDCIVSPEGTLRIIDFNDWPSFAPCRKEAAKAIANVILKRVYERE
ncbi:MAG: hypothetical protein LIP08_15080 [Bacteroides sp.]|nr:hypothetical protein [Bacteroides sp.]